MKEKKDKPTTLRTLIKDISPLGSELSDAQLRLVAGGKPKAKTYRGQTGCIPRGNKPDYVRD
jgi:hypothetical protein